MTDKNDALFLVRLPFGQKTIPCEEVPELIAMGKSPGFDYENEHEAVMLALGVRQEEDALRAAVHAGEVEVLNKSLHRIGPPFIGRLEDTVLTVRALRDYVQSIQGGLEVEDAPEPQAVTPSPAPLSQAYAEEFANRRAANCYDIHEAAQAIALQLGLNEYRTEKLRDDMGQAAFDGALTVRSPGGHDQYAPTSPPKTTYGFDSLTTPDDVNQWATKRRFTWRWLSEPQATTPSPAPAGAVGASGGMVELDYSVLATPAALLDAFEKWGMKAAWFDELDSHKWLLNARRQKGQGQRGNVIPPMFCPYAVMCGLVNKVRKATRLKPDTAWRTLEHKFPNVHAAFESHDTRDRTGD